MEKFGMGWRTEGGGGLKFIRAVLPILIAECDFWKCTTILLQRKAQYIPS